MIGVRYDDTMDPTRQVVPVSENGTKYVCRVYFDNRFVGKAEIPRNLFDGGPMCARIGFVRPPSGPTDRVS